MISRTRTLLNVALPACLAICLSAGGTAGAADDIPADVKEAIAYFDKYAPKCKDDGKFADLVHDLSATQDPAAAERIGKILTEDRNPEHHQIAADALSDFPKDPGREAAGKVLAKAVTKGEFGDDEDMQIQLVDALGKLKYVGGCLPICELLLKSDSPWLMLRCVRALGNIKDLHALPALLIIIERYPAGFKWPAGEEVVVDTGASGDADQQAAEAAYNAANGTQHKKGKPPVMFKAYIQELKTTVQKITNDPTIDSGKALRAWMVARTDELKKLGIEIPKYKGATPQEDDSKKKK